jgi:hypothetical protein
MMMQPMPDNFGLMPGGGNNGVPQAEQSAVLYREQTIGKRHGDIT